MYDGSVGVENINPHEELKKLEAQIDSATELAALKPIFFRLNEIIQAFPGDFDVQFSGNDVKQRLMSRGTLLKQLEASPLPPPAPPQQNAADDAGNPQLRAPTERAIGQLLPDQQAGGKEHQRAKGEDEKKNRRAGRDDAKPLPLNAGGLRDGQG